MNELKNEKRLIIGVFVLEMPIIYLPTSLLNFNSNCFEIRLLFLIISIGIYSHIQIQRRMETHEVDSII